MAKEEISNLLDRFRNKDHNEILIMLNNSDLQSHGKDICTRLLEIVVKERINNFSEFDKHIVEKMSNDLEKCIDVLLKNGAVINSYVLRKACEASGIEDIYNPSINYASDANLKLLIKYLSIDNSKINEDILKFFCSKPFIIDNNLGDSLALGNSFLEKYLAQLVNYKHKNDPHKNFDRNYKSVKFLLQKGISTSKTDPEKIKGLITKNYIIQAREISKLFSSNQKSSAQKIKNNIEELTKITGSAPDFELIIGRFNKKLDELNKKGYIKAKENLKQKFKESDLLNVFIGYKSIGQILFENSSLKEEFKDVKSYIADGDEYSIASDLHKLTISKNKEITKEKIEELKSQFFKINENEPLNGFVNEGVVDIYKMLSGADSPMQDSQG